MHLFIALISFFVLSACGSNGKMEDTISVPITCKAVDHGTPISALIIGESFIHEAPDNILSASHVNCSASGATTTDILRDFSVITEAVRDLPVTDVYIALGLCDSVTDQATKESFTGFVGRYQNIIENLQERGYAVHVLGILPTAGYFYTLNEGSLYYNTAAELVSLSTGADFINIRPSFSDQYGWLDMQYSTGSNAEGLHLNAEGYAVLKTLLP